MIVFSLPIYFIVFRESLEAAIIVSVLLSLVEQLTHDDGQKHESQTQDSREKSSADTTVNVVADDETKRRLARKLRMQVRLSINYTNSVHGRLRQILLGAGFGFLLAFILGAAFIAVWFTQASDLYKKSEELWEGC